MILKDNAAFLLRKERLREGISEVEMSKRMGLNSSQHYWNIENGRNRLTLEYLFLASKALDIDPYIFIYK